MLLASLLEVLYPLSLLEQGGRKECKMAVFLTHNHYTKVSQRAYERRSVGQKSTLVEVKDRGTE